MADPTTSYLTVLFIGIGLTLVVGQILVISGRPILEDVFPKPGTASSVTRLLSVLFHLIVLGVIALVASVEVAIAQPVQAIVVRVGLVLLVLGIAYGSTLLLLVRLRARRRQQMLTDERRAQVEQAQQTQIYGQPPSYGQQSVGSYPPPATTHTYPTQTPPSAGQTYPTGGAQVYPVNEAGPGR